MLIKNWHSPFDLVSWKSITLTSVLFKSVWIIRPSVTTARSSTCLYSHRIPSTGGDAESCLHAWMLTTALKNLSPSLNQICYVAGAQKSAVINYPQQKDSSVTESTSHMFSRFRS